MLQSSLGARVNEATIIDTARAGETLDGLMDFVSEALPVDATQYPSLAHCDQQQQLEFCLHHSALHFSKTAGKLAAFAEMADHGRFARIEALQAIVAASLVNSLKLADEIGLTGSEIIEAVRLRFELHDSEAQRR